MTITLPTNLAAAPATLAIKEGRVSSNIVALDLCGPKTAHAGFKDMLRHEKYLAGELAIVTFLQARAYGLPYVMLPYPTSGRLQHHCIGYNVEAGVRGPKDIEGGRVGVRMYAQTTGLWVRGVLQHEYGVDLDKVQWETVEDAHVADYADPSNCNRLPAGSDLVEMLKAGTLDAVIMGPALPADPQIATLIPDAIDEGQRWSVREGVIPVNHMFVVHQDVSRQHPDAVREIFRMLVEARAAAPESVRQKLPPIGLEANRKVLQMAIDWSLEQKLLPRRLSVDELFDDATAHLAA
jgi:4,5-dihydroxyphthalate decarboxylase